MMEAASQSITWRCSRDVRSAASPINSSHSTHGRRRAGAPRGFWSGAKTPSDAVGLRVIVGFKFLKAGLELAFGILVLWLVATGFTDRLMAAATQFRHHVAEPWSVDLAQLLMHTATVRHLRVIALAALIDGASSLVEGWALFQRFWWSGWLIVCTTSAAIPLEVIAVIRHPNVIRSALLVANVLIVGYLIHRRAAVTT
jgi:uncharacterized membrane protein (DUF2068 family)